VIKGVISAAVLLTVMLSLKLAVAQTGKQTEVWRTAVSFYYSTTRTLREVVLTYLPYLPCLPTYLPTNLPAQVWRTAVSFYYTTTRTLRECFLTYLPSYLPTYLPTLPTYLPACLPAQVWRTAVSFYGHEASADPDNKFALHDLARTLLEGSLQAKKAEKQGGGKGGKGAGDGGATKAKAQEGAQKALEVGGWVGWLVGLLGCWGGWVGLGGLVGGWVGFWLSEGVVNPQGRAGRGLSCVPWSWAVVWLYAARTGLVARCLWINCGCMRRGLAHCVARTGLVGALSVD
jgi:hypothetical protein